ncbi:MAG: hypothetical protein JWM57_3454, partial [Phycisphaerales bacterium]|nr:hypothetical protein [Phycisphaerales bacterium]
IDDLCPPLRALVHIMATGNWEGLTEGDAKFRAMFNRDAILASDWYAERLLRQQRVELKTLDRHAAYVDARLTALPAESPVRDELTKKLAWVKAERIRVTGTGYVDSLRGTIGADPVCE